MEPCDTCAKLVIAAGIKKVVCEMSYHGAKRTREMFKESGVELKIKKDVMPEYGRQELK